MKLLYDKLTEDQQLLSRNRYRTALITRSQSFIPKTTKCEDPSAVAFDNSTFSVKLETFEVKRLETSPTCSKINLYLCL